MKNEDPRPMPQSVLRAYMDPLNLMALFKRKIVFSIRDRSDVRDRLLMTLIDKHGVAEVFVTIDGSESVPVSVLDLPEIVSGGPLEAITAMMAIEEYGGEEGVKIELAKIMQPYWASWWDTFRWRGVTSPNEDILEWGFAAKHVLGEAQLRWMAAQFARRCLYLVRKGDQREALEPIRLAEEYCQSPSPSLLAEMRRFYRHIRDRSGAEYFAREACDLCCGEGALYSFEKSMDRASIAIAIDMLDRTMSPLEPVPSSVEDGPYHDEARDILANLARSLITPTLITSPSRGLR